MDIHAVLHEASSSLKKAISNDEEKLEARLLLQHVLEVNHAWLITHAQDEIDTKPYAEFNALIQRRMLGEPIAYILGKREFYGLPLTVTPDTLIPRPDTETLVETALAHIPKIAVSSVLDLGTGTGAIAIAIAKHRKNTEVIAVDASKAALRIAQENEKNLNIPNVQFILSDWFNALGKKRFDVVMSNPPYIEQEDIHLNQGDLRFEPRSALASGDDGLDDVRQIIQQAPAHLNPEGWLMLEHGYNQASAVSDLLKQADFKEIECILDTAGIQRVTIGRI